MGGSCSKASTSTVVRRSRSTLGRQVMTYQHRWSEIRLLRLGKRLTRIISMTWAVMKMRETLWRSTHPAHSLTQWHRLRSCLTISGQLTLRDLLKQPAMVQGKSQLVVASIMRRTCLPGIKTLSLAPRQQETLGPEVQNTANQGSSNSRQAAV